MIVVIREYAANTDFYLQIGSYEKLALSIIDSERNNHLCTG
jgi:hypothetical protein